MKALILVTLSSSCVRRRSRRRVRSSLTALAAGCCLAACGTTVPLNGTTAASDGLVTAPDGIGVVDPVTGEVSMGIPDAPSAAEGAVGTPTLPGGSTGGSGGTPASDPAAGGPAATSGAAPGAPAVVAAPGKRAPIRIGFTTVPDAAAFFASFGGSASNVDQAALIRSAVAWVNKNGGLNGHPIDPYIAEVSATSQESYDSQYQRLCAEYTQDAKVVAASNVGIGANTNMDECMNRAGALFVTGSNTLHDEVNYQRTPMVVSPSEVSVSVLAKTLAELIVSRRFEVRGGKVGLLNYDLPEYNRAIEKYFKPILAAAGIGLVRYEIPPPASTSEIGNSVSVVQSAQLRMASEGVKTATFLCAGCAGFFIQSASSQNYYPRYVLSSLDTPGSANGETFERSLRTSVSVGWLPVSDYGDTTPPGPVPHSRTYDQCLEIQKETGATTNPNDRKIALLTCDAVLSFYYAAKANPAEPMTAKTLRDGLLRLGTSHPSALNFATNLTPQRHAGASQYRLMTWNDECACPSYSGPAIPFPTL